MVVWDRCDGLFWRVALCVCDGLHDTWPIAASAFRRRTSYKSPLTGSNSGRRDAALLMTALYVISFGLDWWYVSTSDLTSYTPSRWYLGIPLVALSNFVRPVVATPLIIIGGAYYLRQRARFVGRPKFSSVLG